MRVFLLNEINKYDSVGINLLSAILKQHGNQSRVFLIPDLIENTTISMPWLKIFKYAYYISDDAYIDFLLSFKPDVIAFSVVTSYWKRASRLAKIVKKKDPSVFTIAGGPHPTLSLYKDMFDEGGFDYICRGDGEIALPELIEALSHRNYDPQVPGVYYFRNNQIRGEGLGKVVHDLDALPFQDKSDVFRDYPFLQKTYNINTQRSCQYSCSYCGSPEYRKVYAAINERVFRRRSVDNVIKELLEAKRRYPKMRRVGFFDDTFTTGEQWIRDFAKAYKKYIGLPYFMCTNPCLLQDEELISQLKSSGLIYVEIGIQAVDEDYRLNKVKRPDKDYHIFRTAQLLRKYNIYIQANHIFGLDLRDFSDDDFLKKTVEYYIRLNPNRTHCFELEYLPGSEEAKRALAENRITEEQYTKILRGEVSVSYNFGGSLDKGKKKFVPYLVLLELMPFIPRSWAVSILHSKSLFRIVKLIPFNYIILARLLNTLKDKRDVEGSPHYGKYIDGAKYIFYIKKHLRSYDNKKNEKENSPVFCQ